VTGTILPKIERSPTPPVDREREVAEGVVFGALSLTRVGNREAYHATKAVLAGLRSRSICSAGYRNGYYRTARIAYLIAQKATSEVPEPRHETSVGEVFLWGDNV
jgi:hypothetical protein